MARLRVSTSFLAERLLPGVKAEFTAVVRHDERSGYIDFEIVGPDVPDSEMVCGTFTTDYSDMRSVPTVTLKLIPV